MVDHSDNPALVDLEVKLAYQEKSIAELNEALVDQSRTVIELTRRVEALEKVVRGISEQVVQALPGPANERPPHY